MNVKKKYKYTEEVKRLDPKDRSTFEKFITEHGKIIPARLTSVSARQQRKIKKVVKQARSMGTL